MNKIFRAGLTAFVFFSTLSLRLAAAAPSVGFPADFADFQTADLAETIENIVRIVIGFLGILIVVAIIFGGFLMMTSGGDSDKMGNGRKIVVSGAIGLIIVLGAYAIANFVVKSLSAAL